MKLPTLPIFPILQLTSLLAVGYISIYIDCSTAAWRLNKQPFVPGRAGDECINTITGL
jgi:hypothetical protein